MAVQPQGCVPAPYQPRRPADTPLYRVVQNHLETFLALCRDDWEEERVSPHAERELRRFLECGILAYGFARARCDDCGHDFLIAFSCKGRGVCPSRNTRRMAETAAHLADHVLPRLPVRQWVLSLPKRLRYHLQHDREALNSALRIPSASSGQASSMPSSNLCVSTALGQAQRREPARWRSSTDSALR